MSLKSLHLSKNAHNILSQLAVRKNAKAQDQDQLNWLLNQYHGFADCAICGAVLDVADHEDDEHGLIHLKEYNLLAFL